MKIRLGNTTLTLPRSRIARIIIGILLIIGGLLGFLPVVGFWMIPLGLMVLSADLPLLRRLRRRVQRAWGRWRRRREERTPAESGAAAASGDEEP
ncbi:MAG: hypothetical protein Kow0032_23270 [Methyloligellaceae bacterium]